jgi:hypothetical protein
MYSAMMSAALALNDQSLRGHIAFRAALAAGPLRGSIGRRLRAHRRAELV